MNKNLISIIIPTYNRAHLIGKTLESITNQTYSNWECIIVDDGSSDNTEVILNELIQKDSRFQYHKRPNNRKKGASSCRNYGFEVSKGDYINWLDSDDLYFPNTLSMFVNNFEKENDLVVGKIELIDLKTSRKIRETTIKSTSLIEDYFIGKVAFYISGPMWRKFFLENKKELFDEKISNLDDWDFNLRMIYENPNIKYIEDKVVQYRVNEGSLSNEICKFNFAEIQSELYAREKHLKILSKKNFVGILNIKTYIKDRYSFFLKEALIRKSHHKYYFLKKTLTKQIKLFEIKDVIKTLSVFVFYSIFNKGYRFLK